MLAFLQSHHVAELVASKMVLVEGTSLMTVQQCLDTLHRFNILALPIAAREGQFLSAGGIDVVTDDHRQYIGIVSITDIVLFLAASADVHDQERRLQQPVWTVIGSSREGQSLWVCEPEKSLYYAFEPLSKHVHRMLVRRTDSDGSHFFTLMTQTDAMLFLLQHAEHLEPTISQPLSAVLPRCAAPATGHELLRIPTSASALDGLLAMHRAGFTAVPIVDSLGHVVATLSDSDLRGMHAAQLSNLRLPVLEFLQTTSPNVRSPVTAVASISVGEAIRLVVTHRIHRLWLVDGAQLCGVVSLTDLIGLFAAH